MGPTMGHESNYLGDSMQYQYTNAHYYATFVGYTDSMTPLSSPYLSFSVNENGMVPYDMYAIYSINGMGWNVLPIGSGYMTTDCTIDLSGYSISSMSTITIDVDVVYSMTTSFYWSVTLNGSI
jgi:hypothetical protein